MTGEDDRLTVGNVATALWPLYPDRDQKASPLCTESLLALLGNTDRGAGDELVSPKVSNFAVRSLIFGENFLDGQTDRMHRGDMTREEYGQKLSIAEDFNGSDNLNLAREALGNLIDTTEGLPGQRGEHLLMPFHESLLWYDARKSKSSDSWSVRQVRMRGKGMGIARILIDPPPGAGEDTLGHARTAREELVRLLRAPSPFGKVAEHLESPLHDGSSPRPAIEDAERRWWELAGEDATRPFAKQFSRHLAGVATQKNCSPSDKLWQTRSILALDLASNYLQSAWERSEQPQEQRFLLVCAPGLDRKTDTVRLASERSYKVATTSLRDALVTVIAETMAELQADMRGGAIDFEEHLELRKGAVRDNIRETVIDPYEGGERDFQTLATNLYKSSSYHRAIDGYRVLLRGIGCYAGGDRYRYQTFRPELFRALIGALSADMPMESGDFFARLREEWGFVASDKAAEGTLFEQAVPSGALANNKSRFEEMLVSSGLASSESDTTVLVGEYVAGA